MSQGKEYLKEIHAVLREFEEAVTARAKWKPLEGKVNRQQTVDHARQRVVDTVVAIVTKERTQKS